MTAPRPGPVDVTAAQVTGAKDGLGDGAAAGARAYCGELHGRSWFVPADRPPPVVRLPAGDGAVAYRLVLCPRSDRPARDHRGNYVYVPLNYPLVAGSHCESTPAAPPDPLLATQ